MFLEGSVDMGHETWDEGPASPPRSPRLRARILLRSLRSLCVLCVLCGENPLQQFPTTSLFWALLDELALNGQLQYACP